MAAARSIQERRSRIEGVISSLTEQNVSLREQVSEMREENEILWNFLEESRENEDAIKEVQRDIALKNYINSLPEEEIGEA